MNKTERLLVAILLLLLRHCGVSEEGKQAILKEVLGEESDLHFNF